MRDSQTFDVIAVGSGPGGAVAAKRCAEAGLNTLLIEKKKLPRDKVCTGMVMGDWARDIISQEFGDTPETVLAQPPRLSGYRIYVGETKQRTLEWDTPWAWRKDLDFWMVQKAKEAGVTIREGAKFVRLRSERDLYRVTILEDGTTQELRTRFLIGADGATSIVRKSTFPELKVRYVAPARKCYRGTLGLDKNYVHYFFPKGRPRPRFGTYQKNDVFLIEGRAIRELRREINETLGMYGFQPQREPEWRDSCALAILHEPLLSGRFVPADENILLIGDAAGLIFPVTFEGIGSALKSGIAAAECIAKAAKTGRKAAGSYLAALEPILETIRTLRSVQYDLENASHESPSVCAESIEAAYRETLTIQRA